MSTVCVLIAYRLPNKTSASLFAISSGRRQLSRRRKWIGQKLPPISVPLIYAHQSITATPLPLRPALAEVFHGTQGRPDRPTRPLYLANAPIVPTADPIRGGRITAGNQMFGRRFSGNKEIHAAIGEQNKSDPLGQRASGTPVPQIGFPGTTARFRLHIARSGGEDHQLAVRQLWLRVPAGAQASVPAHPWPARGVSWIRDSTRYFTRYRWFSRCLVPSPNPGGCGPER
jgi:hypothetical protein